jgi:hypothetical protein
MAKTKLEKMDATGDKMKELGHLINGIVWGSVFLAIIGFLLYQSLFG